MISRIYTVAFAGISPKLVDVQVDIAKGLPSFSIVGLADKTVSESKDRLRSAFSSIGLALPAKRITVNLSPANLAKEGSHFDLPIALAILGAMEILPVEELINYIALGEISLDGAILATNGVLASAILAEEYKKGIIFPQVQSAEMFLLQERIDYLPIRNLLEVVSYLRDGQSPISSEISNNAEQEQGKLQFTNLRSIKGQESAKRALEVVASGKHSMLMIGPPGSGKSMLANALGGILPPLTSKEMLDVSLIYSVSGELQGRSLIAQRPYRCPHHSASMPSLIGGGTRAKPGEITLAHNGILFLDELAEFNKSILDALRQPIETGEVHISRVNSHVTYPANFQLIGAMNPCRCGYFGDEQRSCSKAPACAESYQSKVSGPILDRIDITIEVPPISMLEMNNESSEGSEEVSQRVLYARNIQMSRYDGLGITTNAEASSDIVDKTAKLTQEATHILQNTMTKMNLSTRAYYRLIKVARTCADLDISEDIKKQHIAEAISYRRINYYHKQIWG